MKKLIKKSITIAIIIVVSSLSLYAQNTIIDTVYSIPELDGGIFYVINNGIYMVDNTYGAFYVGDWWGAIQGSVEFGRGFLAYPLPDIPQNYSLNSATLFVFQNGSIGNDEEGIYPIFNLASGDVEPPCLIEHLDYGNYLDESDFSLPALHPADTISTTPEQDWRSLEVTDWVIDDIQNSRPYTQSRLRLSLNYDTDYLMDLLCFRSANSTEYKPFMIYEYIADSSADEDYPVVEQKKIYIYPNPVNGNSKIDYFLSKQQHITIDLYNIRGQKISNLFSGLCKSGRNEISLNIANLSNGIYFLKLEKNEYKSITKKIVILR